MLVNDGEMLVKVTVGGNSTKKLNFWVTSHFNDGEMLVNDGELSIWSYINFTICRFDSPTPITELWFLVVLTDHRTHGPSTRTTSWPVTLSEKVIIHWVNERLWVSEWMVFQKSSVHVKFIVCMAILVPSTKNLSVT